MVILVGDIGGTKTILAYIDLMANNFNPSNLQELMSFQSIKYESIETIINEYLQKINKSLSGIVLAIAGPIIDGKSKLTNLPWNLDEKNLKKAFKIDKVKFLNDLEASAYYIPYLATSDLEVLQEGISQKEKNICVISPGTGLGEAFLTWNGKNYVSHATEGGHTSFSPESDEQIKLLQYMREKIGKRVSVERVCSGIGIRNIFEFLISIGYKIEPEQWKNELSSTSDPVPIIMNMGNLRKGESLLCDKTIELFTAILGSECADFALKTMSLGGVFIGGGIPPKIISYLKNTNVFLQFFVNKGRMSPLIANLPVNVILNQNTTLLGCGKYCQDKFL
jgi:glucokinase